MTSYAYFRVTEEMIVIPQCWRGTVAVLEAAPELVTELPKDHQPNTFKKQPSPNPHQVTYDYYLSLSYEARQHFEEILKAFHTQEVNINHSRYYIDKDDYNGSEKVKIYQDGMYLAANDKKVFIDQFHLSMQERITQQVRHPFWQHLKEKIEPSVEKKHVHFELKR